MTDVTNDPLTEEGRAALTAEDLVVYADRMLYAYLRAKVERDQNKASFDAQVEDLSVRLDTVQLPLVGRMAHLTTELRWVAEHLIGDAKKRSRKFINGVLAFRKTKLKITVEDDDAVRKAATGNPQLAACFRPVPPKLSMHALRSYIENAGGDIPPGVKVEDAEDNFHVTVTGED